MQINYNHLESGFLVCSCFILILGLVFASKGFGVGSVGYKMLTFVRLCSPCL